MPDYRRCGYGRSAGFSLIELMVALVVLGIVASIAFPSFTRMIRSANIEASADELATGLQFARSEAIQRNEDVQLVPKNSDGNYADGWLIVLGVDNTQLRVFDEGFSGSVACENCVGTLSFSGSGFVDRSVVFRLVDDDLERCIGVTLSGGISLVSCPAG